MWLVLLDHSGSMGNGFAVPAGEATFRDRRTLQAVKLDAAVESVLIDLRRLRPDNGTDIAAALDAARAQSGSLSPRPLVIRVLLVTDGLSDLDEARRAAA